MHDHSHKFLFLAATSIMCVAALYGSEAGPSFLLSDIGSPSATAGISEAPSGHGSSTGLAQAVSFSTSDTDGPRDEGGAVNQPASPGTATVVPNGASCPAVDAGALLSPPSVNGVIGSPTPVESEAPSRQSGTSAGLGTGSSCPLARSDVGAIAKTQSQPGLPSDPKARAKAGASERP